MTRDRMIAMAIFVMLYDRLARFPCAFAEGEEAPGTELNSTNNMTEEELMALRAEAEAAEAKAQEAVKRSQESGQKALDTFYKLKKQLNVMKAALAEQGEEADPELKERVTRLESDIKELTSEFSDTADVGLPTDVNDLLTGCTVMSLKRVGAQRPSTLAALRMVSENNASPEEAAKKEVWRMISLCISGFTEQELLDYKAGSLKTLPDKYVEAAKTPEAEQVVINLDENIWKELRILAAGILKEVQTDGESAPLPTMYGWLAMIVMLAPMGFFWKLYKENQRMAEEKRAKKEKKDAKKSK